MEKNRRKFLKHLTGITGMAGISTVSPIAFAGNQLVQVQDIRLSRHDGYVRLVFDTDKAVKHSIFTLHKPERIVLDLKSAKMPHGLIDQMAASSMIKNIRSGIRNGTDIRVVFDLQSNATPRSFILAPAGRAGHRLVLDLHGSNSQASNKAIHLTKKTKKKLRDVVVAIDPGHGGRDPGATGRAGTSEKTVTLQIAKKLERTINAQPGMRAVLTRSTDRFLRLRQRIANARKNNADMMISIHADSYPDPRARGSSIYALSVNGASSETARLMAEKENASDLLFGDFNLDVEDKMVKEVLFDLSLTGTIESSLDIGAEIINHLGKVNRIHKRKVQQAAFAVLKAPNIPSILLETAFLSNPREEKNLKSASHQRKVAKAIGRGVSEYFSRKAPPGTWLSAERSTYRVKSGDSLAYIARKYDISVENLRARNALHSTNLSAGQVIKIPVS